MNEKVIDAYKTKINEINEKVMKAYKEKNIYKLIDLYGAVKYFNGCLRTECLNEFNDEINNLVVETIDIANNIYSIIVNIL